jgi:peptidoglycan/xylan/chitin deacetylase (PgdA/CDA1 family)
MLASLKTFFLASLCGLLTLGASAQQTPGDTRVAKWQGDAKAAFLLMFDDGWPSHWQVAVPELAKRDMTATFYINPGKGEYLKFKDTWEKELWKQGMVYGNHTLTHKGAKSLEEADREIGECNRAITSMVPGKVPRLISYGQPGVGPGNWTVTAAELNGLLAKYHLIDRPPFAGHGAVYHWQTTAQMLALADRAIATNGMEYLVIHGVERIKPNWSYQDFWALKQDVFLPLLDALKERRDRGDLWITDHISQHQYETERNAASVQVTERGSRQIRIRLTCSADPAFYDLPLTLVTRVPPQWPACAVTQGTNQCVVAVAGGFAKYRALPGPSPVMLRPAAAR